MQTDKSAIERTKDIIEKAKNYLSMIFDIPLNEIYLEELGKENLKWKITFSFYELIPSKAQSVSRNPILQAFKPYGDIEPKPNYRKVYKKIELEGLDDTPIITNYTKE